MVGSITKEFISSCVIINRLFVFYVVFLDSSNSLFDNISDSKFNATLSLVVRLYVENPVVLVPINY